MENSDIALFKDVCKSLFELYHNLNDSEISTDTYYSLIKAAYLLGKFDPISLEDGSGYAYLKKYEQEYISWHREEIRHAKEKTKSVSTPVHDSSGCRNCSNRNGMCAKVKKFPCLLHTKELTLVEMWEQKQKEMGL